MEFVWGWTRVEQEEREHTEGEDGVPERGIKGWRSTIRTSHLNFSPPKPHGCPHSDLYQASFTPSSSPLTLSPSLFVLSHPLYTLSPSLSLSLSRASSCYYTRLTFATSTLFDCATNRFAKRKPATVGYCNTIPPVPSFSLSLGRLVFARSRLYYISNITE